MKAISVLVASNLGNMLSFMVRVNLFWKRSVLNPCFMSSLGQWVDVFLSLASGLSVTETDCDYSHTQVEWQRRSLTCKPFHAHHYWCKHLPKPKAYPPSWSPDWCSTCVTLHWYLMEQADLWLRRMTRRIQIWLSLNLRGTLNLMMPAQWYPSQSRRQDRGGHGRCMLTSPGDPFEVRYIAIVWQVERWRFFLPSSIENHDHGSIELLDRRGSLVWSLQPSVLMNLFILACL